MNLWLARAAKLETIAKGCGKSRATVALWGRKVLNYGFGALKPQWSHGRKRRIDDGQMEEIKEALGRNPKEITLSFDKH